MHLAVVVENAPAARPQTRLHEAALVYEVPVEGGITRFLAIYSRAPSGPVGPVRSLRSYLMDLAEAHDVPLVFCGGSPDSLAMVKQKSYPAINELNGGTGFYRDSARKMPHNLTPRLRRCTGGSPGPASTRPQRGPASCSSGGRVWGAPARGASPDRRLRACHRGWA